MNIDFGLSCFESAMESHIQSLNIRRFRSISNFALDFQQRNLVIAGSEEDQDTILESFHFVLHSKKFRGEAEAADVSISTISLSSGDVLLFRKQVLANQNAIFEVTQNGNCQPVSDEVYVNMLWDLGVRRGPLSIDVHKLGLFTHFENIGPTLCDEFGLPNKKAEQEELMFERRILKKKLRHLKENDAKFNNINIKIDQQASAELPARAATNDFDSAARVLNEAPTQDDDRLGMTAFNSEFSANMKKLDKLFERFDKQVIDFRTFNAAFTKAILNRQNGNAERGDVSMESLERLVASAEEKLKEIKEEESDEETEHEELLQHARAERVAAAQEELDEQNRKVQRQLDRFAMKLQQPPLDHLEQNADLRTFDAIKHDLLKQIGGQRAKDMKRSVVFDSLASNTLFAKDAEEAKRFIDFLRKHNIRTPYEVRIGPVKNGEIDVSAISKPFIVTSTLENARKMLINRPNDVIVTKSGIVLHSNGLIECGYSNAYEEANSDDEWDLEDCLNASENRIDGNVVQLNDTELRLKLQHEVLQNSAEKIDAIERRKALIKQTKFEIDKNVMDRSDSLEQVKSIAKAKKAQLSRIIKDYEQKAALKQVAIRCQKICRRLTGLEHLRVEFAWEDDTCPLYHHIRLNCWLENPNGPVKETHMQFETAFGLCLSINEVMGASVIITSGLNNVLSDNVMSKFVSHVNSLEQNKQIISFVSGPNISPSMSLRGALKNVLEIYRATEDKLQLLTPTVRSI